jgi:hypothetical protein
MRTLTAVILALAAFAAIAQPAPAPVSVRQYAAKFVCGKAGGEQTETFNVAPGSYFTTINVHNPALTSAVRFRKKFAVANPNEEGGKISEWFAVTLKADQALQIDCGSIYKHLGIAAGTFIDGFAVIQMFNTSPQLDVVGVYTASPGNGVSSIDVERFEGRITQ